jgi:hypothetical protein
MAWRKLRVPGRALTITAALGLAAGMLVVLAPTAIGAQPSCAVSNTRNHKGFSSLQDAVTAAKAGDTLEVKGTCVGNTTLDRDVTLSGIRNKAFPGTPTLDGNQAGRVLDISAGTATIRNLVITNGLTDGPGGGIWIEPGAAAEVFDSVVSDNTAGAATFGGGIDVDGVSLLLVRSAVTGNSAGGSGGIDMDFSTVSLVSSSVTGNAATHAPSTTPDGCLFSGTVYACSGGIWNFHGVLSLTNSTVSSNTSAYAAGGLRTDSTVSSGLVTDGITYLAGSTTFASNAAANGGQGGGIWARARIAGTTTAVDPSPAFRVAGGSMSYTDPLTGATLPAWTGSLSGNTPDQCFAATVPPSGLTLGTHTCGLTFN